MINMNGLMELIESFFVFAGIVFVIFICGYLHYSIKKNDPVENYPLDKVSVIKLQADNCSPKEKQRRMVKGYYDKTDKHPY